jgi:hypothetical protein
MAVILPRHPSALVCAFLATRHDSSFNSTAASDSNACVASTRTFLFTVFKGIVAIVSATALTIAVIPQVGVISNTAQVPPHPAVALPEIQTFGITKQ